MPSTKTTPDMPKHKTVDMARLSQSDAAWLIGKQTSWLRNHSHQFDRDDDGSYDGRQVVTAMLEAGPTAAELSDEHLEPMRHWLYSITNHEGALTGCLRILGEIVQKHGFAGLAAIGKLVQSIAEENLRQFPEKIGTPKEIRAKHSRAAEQEIANLDKYHARRDMRIVTTCDRCGNYRWGRKWREQPIPKGYVVAEKIRCEDCLEATGWPQ